MKGQLTLSCLHPSLHDTHPSLPDSDGDSLPDKVTSTPLRPCELLASPDKTAKDSLSPARETSPLESQSSTGKRLRQTTIGAPPTKLPKSDGSAVETGTSPAEVGGDEAPPSEVRSHRLESFFAVKPGPKRVLDLSDDKDENVDKGDGDDKRANGSDTRRSLRNRTSKVGLSHCYHYCHSTDQFLLARLAERGGTSSGVGSRGGGAC